MSWQLQAGERQSQDLRFTVESAVLLAQDDQANAGDAFKEPR